MKTYEGVKVRSTRS